MSDHEQVHSYSGDIGKFINDRIWKLRPRLLDLTKRNPLISMKLSERYNALVRIVDEQPAVLLERLSNGKGMELISLPDLEEEPKDEKTEEFRQAYQVARHTDEEYLAFMEELDNGNGNGWDGSDILAAERALKDRVRVQLGLVPLPVGDKISIEDHARVHQIDPSYDLPEPDQDPGDERHTDNFIQTLLLQNSLERKLNAIIDKNRRWEQETGVAVLQAVFGSIEWREVDKSRSSFAPLIVLPVSVVKSKNQHGFRYKVTSKGEVPEVNIAISKKFETDFGIVLPPFSDECEIESYFEEVGKAIENKRGWRVRRQAAIGVFPSQHLTMYEDLDPDRFNFASSNVIDALFGGTATTGDPVGYHEPEDLDDSHFEKNLPLIVADVDSSQIAAISSCINDTKSIAIEGPPGSGKSQTIVNIIGAALAKGEKVLFVAEKAAALNVVKSRLDACGLGDFVLPLQANYSSRRSLLDALRTRLGAKVKTTPTDLERVRSKLDGQRSQLGHYLDILQLEFEDTGLSVHRVLGRAMAARDLQDIEGFDVSLAAGRFGIKEYHSRDAILEVGERFYREKQQYEGLDSRWRSIENPVLNPFDREQILARTRSAGEVLEQLNGLWNGLRRYEFDTLRSISDLESIGVVLRKYQEVEPQIVSGLLNRLCEGKNAKLFDLFIEARNALAADMLDLGRRTSRQIDKSLISDLRTIIKWADEWGLKPPSTSGLQDRIEALNSVLALLGQHLDAIVVSKEIVGVNNKTTLSGLAQFSRVVNDYDEAVLGHRSRQLEGNESRKKIRELAENAIALLSEFQELGGRIRFNRLPAPDEINDDIRILETARWYSWVKPSYRQARSRFVYASKLDNFTADEAAAVLDKYQHCRRREGRLSDNALLKGLLGEGFQIDEIEWAKLIECCQMYERLGTGLWEKGNTPFLNFVRDADTDRVLAMPLLPSELDREETAGISVFRVEKLYQEWSAVRDKMQEQFEEFSAIYKALGLETEFALDKLNLLIADVEKFIAKTNKLYSSPDTESLFASLECRARDSLGNFLPTREFVETMSAVPRRDWESLVAVLTEGNLTELLEAITVIDELYRSILGALSEINATTGVGWSIEGDVVAWNIDYSGLSEAGKDDEGLKCSSTFAKAKSDLSSLSVVEPVLNLARCARDFEEFKTILRLLFDLGLAKRVYDKFGNQFSSYSGVDLDRMRKRIKELDKKCFELARIQLRGLVANTGSLPIGNGRGPKRSWTEMSLIKNELGKQKRHIPVRDLVRRAGKSLFSLMPCWMMSPLAVSQYINKNELSFDLIVIDEASQMTPENAVGALVRGKRAVVVGDTKQLPPTNFFRKMFDIDDDDDDETVEESILELANSCFNPVYRLRWHYRSRHSGLIAFSNHHVYDDGLVIFPSPSENASDRGVSLVKVDGLYAAGLNPEEARVMAVHIEEFMRKYPQRSLGVVLLNQKQRDLVFEEVESRLKYSRVVADYIEYWEDAKSGLEPFFVKNLENVQGDERDVIMIGTVYGKSKGSTRVAQRFGPINGVAGKRRLNVLFTRSREQIITFSSMTASDILVDGTSNEGKQLLKNWLQYSATGELPLAVRTGQEPDSEFEEFVAQAIEAMGFKVTPQVGVSGYRIDIGIEHHKWPHGFIMGIECDGASYHSVKSARERDRLRQEILEGLGWNLYRIWSTDWFGHTSSAKEKLKSALDARLNFLLESEEKIEVKEEFQPISGDGDRQVRGAVVEKPAWPQQTVLGLEEVGQEGLFPSAQPQRQVGPKYSELIVNRVGPHDWLRIADELRKKEAISESEKKSIHTFARKRALDLTFSYREGRVAFQILNLAADHGLYEF